MFGLVLAASLLISSPDALAARNRAPAPEQVLQVPEELRRELQQRVTRLGRSEEMRMGLLARYLFAPDGLGITYQHDATYTVAEAWRTRRANCLTFTLLTVALAREAGLEAYGQDVRETLLWRQEDQTVYRTTHVNAGIRIIHRRFTVDVASAQVLKRIPPVRIDDQRLIAQYYNNRAAELMAIGQLEPAQLHSAVALKLDPDYAVSWNNAGVLHLRAGRLAEAERHYQRALALDGMNASALSNLTYYYQRIGKPGRARPYQRRLHSVQRSNPFHQFMLALEFERQGDYGQAVSHYRRAIRLHDGEHRFHFGLARAYLKMLKPSLASRELERARQLSQGPARNLYQAKLEILAGSSY